MDTNNLGKFGLSYTVACDNLHFFEFQLTPGDRYLWVKAITSPNCYGQPYALFLIDYKKGGALKDKIIGMVKNVFRTVFSKNGRAVFVFWKEGSEEFVRLISLGKSGLKEDLSEYNLGKVKKDSFREKALFSKNERYSFVSLNDGKGRLIDLHADYYIDFDKVDDAIFSPNNKFVFIQYDNIWGSLMALEESTWKYVLHLEGEKNIECVEFSPKGDWLLCKLSDSSTKLIKLKNFSQDADKVEVVNVKVIAHELGAYDWRDFDPSGKKLLFCERYGDNKIIDLERSDKVLKYQIMPEDDNDYRDEEVAFNSLDLKFSPKGKYLAKNALFGDNMLYDLENGCRSVFRLEGALLGDVFFIFSADENYCAAIGGRSGFVLFDLVKEEIILNLNVVRSCKFSLDNKHVALVFLDGLMRLIDITKEGALEEKTVLTCQGVIGATFSQDGNSLFLEEGNGSSLRMVSLHASGSLDDRTVFYDSEFQRKCHLDVSKQPLVVGFHSPEKFVMLFKPFKKKVLEKAELQKNNLLHLACSNHPREKKPQDVVISCEKEFEPQRRCPKRKLNERQKPNKRQKVEEFLI